LSVPTYTFSFKQVTAASPPRPYVFVTLSNPHAGTYLPVYAPVDTGADECALPASYASLLGHQLDKGAVREIGTGNGTTVAYAHTSCITMSDFSTGDIVIDYMPNLRVPLLGVKSFLSRFVVHIDYPGRTFSLLLPEA
jgi:hypothetical protein